MIHIHKLFFPDVAAVDVKEDILMVCMEMANELTHFLTADNQIVQAREMRMCQFKET